MLFLNDTLLWTQRVKHIITFLIITVRGKKLIKFFPKWILLKLKIQVDFLLFISLIQHNAHLFSFLVNQLHDMTVDD